MPSKPRKWKFRIVHILDAIAENQHFVADMTYDQFCADPKDIKGYHVESDDDWRGHSAHFSRYRVSIPRSTLGANAGRNHIVHGYDQIDPEIVWKVVQDELPSLVSVFERILREVKE